MILNIIADPLNTDVHFMLYDGSIKINEWISNFAFIEEQTKRLYYLNPKIEEIIFFAPDAYISNTVHNISAELSPVVKISLKSCSAGKH